MPLSSITASDPPGAALAGHYELRSRLGEGGYGEVFEAWDSKLQRHVAIKRIKDTTGSKGDPVREARMGAALRHAAFIKIHAIEEDGTGQAIVMELVPGTTIKHAIERSGVGLHDAINWVCQIAEAMHDAHASGLAHGDLKPSNLMVEPDGRVRILDFGLVLRYDALATRSLQTDQPAGTIAYMAPERLQGGRPDASSDIYALGVILYELVTGKHPFAGMHGLALAAAQIHSNSASWSYPDSASTSLVSLIGAMTKGVPQQRIGSMAEVRRNLLELDSPERHVAGFPKSGRKMLVAVAAAAAFAMGIWQAIPALAPALGDLSPYSQALETQQGLAALKAHDHPGNLHQAEQHFLRILDHTPGSAAAGMSLLYVFRYEGDDKDEAWLSKADASAQHALMLNDQLALAHVAKGWVLNSQGRPEQALQAFAQALQLDPGEFFAWYGKTFVLRNARRYADAKATLALALTRFPRERAFLDELGTVQFEQADYRGAEQTFRRSIALQPDTVAAYANLNAALLRQNRVEEAMRVLQQGLQVRPSARLYGNLGNALFARGDYTGAAAAFENALSPTHGAPGEYLNWANLADTLQWIPGRQADAIRAYNTARRLLAPRLARAPNDVLLVSRMGLYAARGGDANTAFALLARATALAPDNGEVQRRAAIAYELLGQRDQALLAISNARRLGIPAMAFETEPDLIALRRDPAYRRD